MSEFNPYAAPKARDIKPAVEEDEEGDIWREGDYVVTVKSCVLPGGCFKCYAPPVKHLKRFLYWHRPWLYIFILLGLLPYLIAHVLMGHSTVIEVPLCRDHLWKRRRAILIAWLLLVPGLVLPFAASISISVWTPKAWEGLGTLMAVLLPIAWIFGAAFYGIVGSRVVTPHKMDKEYIWLKGAGQPYLEHLDYQPEIVMGILE